MAYLPLSTANLPDPVIDPAQDSEPRDYFETFLYTGNGTGVQVGDVIKKPADTTTISSSLIFDDADLNYLYWLTTGTPSTYTISLWFKRGNLDTSYEYLWNGGAHGVSLDSHKISYWDGSTQTLSNRQFKDNFWHHLVFSVNSGTGTIWVDGIQEMTGFSANAWSNNGSEGIRLARYTSTNGPYDGYLAEVHIIDGTAYDHEDFGAFDANGIWIPITVSGLSYGTEGAYLNFADNSSSSSLGTDTSGQENDWSVSGVATTDQVADSPTDNFMTMSTTDQQQTGGSVTLSEGNLRVNHNTDGHWNRVNGASKFGNGKWYYEFQIKTVPTGTSTNWAVGFREFGHSLYYSMNDGFEDVGDYIYWVDTNTAKIVADQDRSAGSTSGITAAVADDYINIAIEKTDGNIKAWFGINGTWFNSGNPATGANPAVDNESYAKALVPAVAFYAYPSSTNGNGIFNFGQKTFSSTIPSGFTAISENNITVDDQNLESPDFVWIKCRDNTRGHLLFDSVRGIQRSLRTNTNGAEDTSASAQNTLTSFNANGFTIGSDSDVNTAGEDFVAWNWKAGTSFSNSAGTNGASIASSGSANTTSGFSIVSYTGDSTGTDGTPSTVAHGLSQAPEMIMFKPLDTYDGAVYHSGLTSASYRLVLFSASGTLAQASDNGFFNGTAPTSSVFSIGSRKHTNSNGGMIAYCFHSVDGFSKFGTYEGTNNANGPYIYLGFKPKFFLLKNIDSALQWIIFDGERDPFNVVGKRLFPATTNGDSPVPSNSAMDFTSNGVKIRIAGGYDVNDVGTYIYMAFAQNPFKYSNAR